MMDLFVGRSATRDFHVGSHWANTGPRDLVCVAIDVERGIITMDCVLRPWCTTLRKVLGKRVGCK